MPVGMEMYVLGCNYISHINEVMVKFSLELVSCSHVAH